MKNENKLRVDISRMVAPKRIINGLAVCEDTNLNYVDVYFPDGSQRCWGYIGRNPKPGDQFAPLSGLKPAVYMAIQAEINDMLGAADVPIVPAVDEPEDNSEDSEDELT